MSHSDEAASGCGRCPCEQAADNLWDYLDDELDGVERDQINAHLGHCPACAQLARDESALKQLVARACSHDAAPQELRAWVVTQFAAWRVEICGGQASYTRTSVTVTRTGTRPDTHPDTHPSGESQGQVDTPT